MRKRVVGLGMMMVLAGSVGARADYPADRKAAMDLVAAGKHEQALAALRTMAQGPVTDFQKSDALEQAVLCADRLRQYDLALELARQIPIVPVSKTVQMNHLLYLRQWKDLVATFGKEDIAAWPDEVAGRAYFLRAQAYSALGDGKNAEEDFRKALERPLYAGVKGQVLAGLGDTYLNLLKDDERALAAYRRIYQSDAARYLGIHAVLSAAGILTRQEKYDQALQELGRIDMSTLTGLWRYEMLCAYGNTLAKQGKTVEAVARYAEAMQAEGITDGQKAAARKAMTELQVRNR